MEKKYVIGGVVILVLLVGGLMLTKKPVTDTKTGIVPGPTALVDQKDIPRIIPLLFKEQNKSGEVGIVNLSEENGKLKVSISLTGAPKDTPQPAHIHMGSCEKIGAVKYPLTNLVNGISLTIVDVKLDSLLSDSSALSINVHKSEKESGVYVSCANLPTLGSSALTPGQTNPPAPTGTSASGNALISPPVMSPRVVTTTKIVTYTNKGFNPASLTIKTGEAVRFINETSQSMWVASDPHPTHTTYSEFDQKVAVPPQGNYTFTFTKTGSWKYHNHRSPSDGGTIIVSSN